MINTYRYELKKRCQAKMVKSQHQYEGSLSLLNVSQYPMVTGGQVNPLPYRAALTSRIPAIYHLRCKQSLFPGNTHLLPL